MIEGLLGQCANVVVPEASEQAMRYYVSGNWLWALSSVVELLIPFLFLVTGFTLTLAKFAGRVGRNWFFTIAVYLVLFTVISAVISFPLEYYSGFIRQHAYGLSNQTFGRWIETWGKELSVSIIGAVAFIWIFYLLLKKSPKRWWLYGAVVAIAISFVLMVIQPIWIEPLFHHFGPMKNKELEEKILTLAAQAGIEGGRVFEVDMSQDTKMLNAYVTGLGATKRIVLWDTTIDRLSTDEILFVMGHEMGHYVLRHMWWGFGFFSLLFFIMFYLTYRLANVWKAKFGVKDLSNIASFPLLILIFSILSFFAKPLIYTFSRQIEHNADTFGLEITRKNQAAGEAFLVLQQDNLANPYPGPLFVFWRASHPPIGERVAFFNSYCPWEEGKPLKYGKFFKE
jgi:STE24 endopeptidase